MRKRLHYNTTYVHIMRPTAKYSRLLTWLQRPRHVLPIRSSSDSILLSVRQFSSLLGVETNIISNLEGPWWSLSINTRPLPPPCQLRPPLRQFHRLQLQPLLSPQQHQHSLYCGTCKLREYQTLVLRQPALRTPKQRLS